MSLQYHPDKVGGGAEATKKFNEIKSAREWLGMLSQFYCPALGGSGECPVQGWLYA